MRVLVIDDSPLVLLALATMLEVDGHSVTTAEGGLAGIQAFERALQENAPHHVVITDFSMPDMEGPQVARHVKASKPGTVVILLTGWGPGVADAHDWQGDVDHILSKPPRLAQLRQALLPVQQHAV